MKLIIVHIGSEELIQAVKDAKNGNIYLDTSGIASSKNNIIEYAIEQIGSEKYSLERIRMPARSNEGESSLRIFLKPQRKISCFKKQNASFGS